MKKNKPNSLSAEQIKMLQETKAINEYNKLGIAAYKSHEFFDAIDYFTKAIECSKTYKAPISYSHRASSYMQIKACREALEDYNNKIVLRRVPNMTSGNLIIRYTNMGFAHYCINDFQLALDYYEKVKELDPNDRDVALMIPRIQRMLENF
jgi:tetratricopeptide (TPR) repeat protein